jgi:hypothetical protein
MVVSDCLRQACLDLLRARRGRAKRERLERVEWLERFLARNQRGPMTGGR